MNPDYAKRSGLSVGEVNDLRSDLAAAHARIATLEGALQEIADPDDSEAHPRRLYEGCQEIAREALALAPAANPKSETGSEP